MSGLSLEMQLLHQRAQDEQGYVIVSCSGPNKIGDILRDARARYYKGGEQAVPPLRIIGVATEEEWVRQNQHYGFTGKVPPEAAFFYKAVAE